MTDGAVERRALVAPVEVRADAGEARTVAGYAAVFNSEADIGGMFREVIVPGAFARALSGDVLALRDHDQSMVLGRTRAGTLRLREDARGLAVEIDLPSTSYARDLAALMTRGDIDGMSFGFRVLQGGDEWDVSVEPPLRTIRQVELFEVSVVTMPAYTDTEAALRSRQDAAKELARRNAEAAQRRIAADAARRKAEAEQRFRRISPGD